MDINQLHEAASEKLEQGKLDEAASLYVKITELVPNDEAALSALMDIYENTDKLKYYLARANYNIVNGKLEYGINDCKKALNIDASNIEAREKLARLYKVTNKPLKAIDEFSRIIEINNEHFQSYAELIDLYSKENALEAAINIAKRANDIFGKRSNFNDILAKLYFDAGDYKKALEVVTDETLKVKILLQDEKNEEAKEILDKFNENSLSKEQKALYYLLYAQYNYNLENFDDALSYIGKYTEIMGKNPLSFQMKALCWEGKKDEFMAAYNFAYMYKAQNKFDEAIVEFTHANSYNPKNKDVLIELAKLYEKNNEKYTAIDFWQKVYELDFDETARNILADFYYKEGDIAMAQKYGKEIQAQKGGFLIANGDVSGECGAPAEEDEGFLNKIINLFSRK